MIITDKMDIFANAAHAAVGQLRKYSLEPYIVHPREVRSILLTFSHKKVELWQEAVALGHDLLEDTKITYDLILIEFGKEIADGILWLTDISKPTDGNRSVRKAIDCEHIGSAPPDVKTIKLADLISNSKSIVENDIGFARTYLREKEKILRVCSDADQGLLEEAEKVLCESLERIRSGCDT